LDEEAQRRCVEIADLRVPTGIGRTAKKGKKSMSSRNHAALT